MAEANIEIADIKEAESLAIWLTGRPTEWGQAIAARVALRVAPIALSIAALPDSELAKHHRVNLIISTFRASLISLISCRHPTEDFRIAADVAYVTATKLIRADVASVAAIATAAADAAYAAAKAVADGVYITDAAFATATAATRAAASATSAADLIWQSVREDCLWLEKLPDRRASIAFIGEELQEAHHYARSLMSEPLWLKEGGSRGTLTETMPDWARRAFDQFAESDLAKTTSFGLIVDWYRALLPTITENAQSAFGKEADIAIATMPPENWEGDPIEVMDRIAEIVEQNSKFNKQSDKQFYKRIERIIFEFLERSDAPVSHSDVFDEINSEGFEIHASSLRSHLERLSFNEQIKKVDNDLFAPLDYEAWNADHVPEQNPATVRARWADGKLFNNTEAISTDFAEALGVETLVSLKDEMQSLAISVGSEGNIDKRPADYIEETASFIPAGIPETRELFALIRREAVLIEFRRTVQEQWPDFLAIRYGTMVDEFTLALDQFSDRRKFDRAKAEVAFEEYDADAIKNDVHGAVDVMRSDLGVERIDESIPRTIEGIRENIILPSNADSGQELEKIRTIDELESLNNVLKQLALKANSDQAANELLHALNEEYNQGMREGILEGAREAGKNDGKRIGKTVTRTVKGVEVGKASTNWLSKRYPKWFGWLDKR